MGADIELTGMGNLIDKLDSMVANSKQVVDKTLEAAAAPILADAQQTTAFHDRSGRLRKSLKISKVKSGKNDRKLVWVGDVDAKAQYSWYVEYGHSNVRARPFMGPAFELHKEEAYRIIKEKLMEALK